MNAKRGNESRIEAVASTLRKRKLTLGTVESGVDGLVSHRFFETQEGPAVLGSSLVVDTPVEAVEAMELTVPPDMEISVESAEAARMAAEKGRTFLGVNICLVVWGRGPELDVSLQHPVHLVINNGSDLIEGVAAVGEDPAAAVGHLVSQAMLLIEGTI